MRRVIINNQFRVSVKYPSLINFKYMSNKFSSLETKIKKSNTGDSNSDSEEMKISFYSKMKICKNCYVLRFMLPTTESTTGLSICQYIYLSAFINNQLVTKPYHPVSLDSDKGFLDIMIKVYPIDKSEPNYGIFSNYLYSLEVNKI